PAATEQARYDRDGEPFPTTYYLTCPRLVAAVSRLEAAGGVESWSSLASTDPLLAASLRSATRHQRELRRRLAAGQFGPDAGRSLDLGIGGTSRPERLYDQLDVVLDALRRRVGETFTVAQLFQSYTGSEDWVREVLAERAPVSGWTRTVGLVGDAAFHLYARGATDYRP